MKPIKKTKYSEDYRKTHLCPRCKYRGDITGGDGYGYNVHCNYAKHREETALKHWKHGKSIDSRGEDREQCALYEEGEPDKVKPKKQLFRPKEVSYGTGYTGDIDRWNG